MELEEDDSEPLSAERVFRGCIWTGLALGRVGE